MVKPVPPQDVVDSWPPRNTVDPETRNHAGFLAITLCFTLFTVSVVAARTYVRFFMLHAPGMDDYFIFVATLAAIALCTTVNLAFNYGWDRHYWDQKDEWFEASELVQWIIQITFVILMTCAKMSALCTYLRAAQGTKYKRFVWATIVIVALWGISVLFATIFNCTPVELYWKSKDGKGCTNEDARLLIATIINIITDIQVVLMPIPILIKLKLPKREKITLGILMCLGTVATIASVVRTVVMSQSLSALRYDMTWNAIVVWIWMITECDLAIICISVPVLRVLVKKWMPHAYGGTNTTGMGPKSIPGSHPHAKHIPIIPINKHASYASLINDNKSQTHTENGIEMYNRPVRHDSLSSSKYEYRSQHSNSRLDEYHQYRHENARLDEYHQYKQETYGPRAV